MTPKSAYETAGDDTPVLCGDAETVGSAVGFAGMAVGDADGTVADGTDVAGRAIGAVVGIAVAVAGRTVVAIVGVAS